MKRRFGPSRYGRLAVATLVLLACAACQTEPPKERPQRGTAEIQEAFDRAAGKGGGIEAVKAVNLPGTGIWVDPNGCSHLIYDDGKSGYLAPMTDENGKHVCDKTKG